MGVKFFALFCLFALFILLSLPFLLLFSFSFLTGTEYNISISLLSSLISLILLFCSLSSFFFIILTPFGLGGRNAKTLTMNFIDNIKNLNM